MTVKLAEAYKQSNVNAFRVPKIALRLMCRWFTKAEPTRW